MIKLIKQIKKNNKVGYFAFLFIMTLFVLAITTPILINSKPIIAKTEAGKVVFPVFSNQKNLNVNYKFAIYPPIKKSPNEYNLYRTLENPSEDHFLGTDDRGRDIFTRIIYGIRVSIFVGFISVVISIFIGVVVGAIAGYYGGIWDIIISRIIEVMMSFPTMFLILAVIAFLGPGLFNIMVVIGFTSWTGVARLMRGEFLKLRKREFVMAAKVLGYSDVRIIFKHILPNALTPIFISATFGIAGAILTESALSFLGLGVQPPTPSWGSMLTAGKDHILDHPTQILWPGIAIFLTVTAYNLFGDALQEVLNPKRNMKK